MTAGGGVGREVLLPGAWVAALLAPASQHSCLPSPHQEVGLVAGRPSLAVLLALPPPTLQGPGARAQVLWGL